MHHLIYLHGFLSSPLSLKAQQTKTYLAAKYPSVNFHCPQLSGDINVALHQLNSLINTLPGDELRFIGSSMGGFLATYAVEQFGGKAALVNPAVSPHELLQHYLGTHQNPYSLETFNVHASHLVHLQDLLQPTLKHPQDYLVLLQTGDETLDYKLAEMKYNEAHLIIEQGGDHSFVDYQKWLPTIIDFLR